MSERARAYVVDDEPLAVQRLVRMLDATERVDVAGSTSDPEEALAFLSDRSRALDVVFLDIEMPGMTGLHLARRIPPGPMIVFVTAYDAFALQAFEVSAVDYLLKPVRAAALDRAIDKIHRFARAEGSERIAKLLTRLDHLLADSRSVDRIASRVGNRVQFIELAQVTHFVAEDKLTCAVTGDRAYVVDAPIAALEPKLLAARFFRIHRATLVNLAFVGELQGGSNGAGTFVRLTDAKRTQLQVARDRVRALKEQLCL